MTKSILHKANTRGQADFGWLQANHSFSFGQFYDPSRVQFGALRVLNDDAIAPGMGFGKHPHDNMEIITIPLEGELEHKDSMGNTAVIKHGDVQVMSAGTGIVHSEYNKSKDNYLKLLQIWVIPDKRGVTPRYDEIHLNTADRENKLQQILSPDATDAGVWIHQQAWFHLGKFSKNREQAYDVKIPTNGVYAFVIKGAFTINDHVLNEKDALGIWETERIQFISSQENSEILLIEVPMLEL